MNDLNKDNQLNYGIKHIAFILDGNGRWAAERNKPRNYGHQRGFTSLFDVGIAVKNRSISYMSVFAFSTENWNRPKQEIAFLFKTLELKLTGMLKKAQKHGIKIVTSGDLSRLPESTIAAIKKAVSETKDNKNLVLNFCVNYGGKDEIVRAINKINVDIKAKIVDEKITPEIFEKYLDNDFPPIDLLIRTSGEKRLSNFMLWQLAYAELIFTPVKWPDYNAKTLDEDLIEYAKRKRRFGGLDNE